MSYQEMLEQAQREWQAVQQGSPPLITVGTATCGRSAGGLLVLRQIREDLAMGNIDARVMEVGCIGLCYAEPLVTITKQGRPSVCYGDMTPERVSQLIGAYLIDDDPLPQMALGTSGPGRIEGIPILAQTAVLNPQVRRVLRNCGLIDPIQIDHYLANGGYSGFMRALGMERTQIVAEIKAAGLRGRGGAGFPTHLKWQFCIDAPGDEKFVICNADEGDPGAFMNRSLLEGDPHSVLEGMLIAGYTIGASVGYIYCRAEYPLALERLRIAIAQMERCGLVGENIQGSGFDFRIEIKQGAGAFVCGEETALIASIEGKRGMPSPRPPFPAVSGLMKKPTIINNVETLANVSMILQKGSTWFAELGTEKSKGTKTFALVGKVKRSGLIEVPLGITLREIVFAVGGGILNDEEFKAVQTGGPSGGCLPAEMLDSQVDYESLAAAGSIMGSGGMVVMDKNTCMVDVARYFLDFTQKESCGECVPCRLGTKQMLDILTDITEGRGRPGDIELLEELAIAVKKGSLCGLGQTAPNPVLTTIRYFRDEYEAHIHAMQCPSLACVHFIRYQINPDKCKACGLCRKACPVDAIWGEKKTAHVINQDKCIKCGVCLETCPAKFHAVEKVADSSTEMVSVETSLRNEVN